ncbi:hypothetical protein, partial [Thermus scotoductus]|uniref:hypothetical protein n=1 Tax=Thermus scotoductus TaxID=37636 RepID=UPI001C12AC59
MDHPRYQIQAAPAREDLPRNGDVGKVLLITNRALPKTPSSPSLSLLQEFLGDFIVEQANQAPQEQVRTIPLA